MNILYIGGGFVGTCSAAAAAHAGHTVLVYDIDPEKMERLGSGDRDQINSALYEQGLPDLLIRHADKITFTASYNDVLSFLDTVDAVYMCLPTPEIGETGESNLSYYESAATEMAANLAKRNGGAQDKYVVIVNKSTVPIDMVDRTKDIFDAHGVTGYGVVSNPEFLVEGKAVIGSLKPDRVVVGAWNEEDFAVMRKVYQQFYDASDVRYLEVNPKEAAAGKLLANFYLFNKLAICFDVIGRTAEAFNDVSFEQLRSIITSDDRISDWGFYDSLYAGGSCFIKDARSLAHQLQTVGENPVIVNETYLANKRQLDRFLGRAQKEAGFDWSGKTVALLGTAFKRGTNDVRNSPSIDIVRFCQEQTVGQVRVYDPAAIPMFQGIYPASEQIMYVESEAAAIAGADVVIVSADWPQFATVASDIAQSEKNPLVMDGRRMLHHEYETLVAAGSAIISVGAPFIPSV